MDPFTKSFYDSVLKATGSKEIAEYAVRHLGDDCDKVRMDLEDYYVTLVAKNLLGESDIPPENIELVIQAICNPREEFMEARKIWKQLHGED